MPRARLVALGAAVAGVIVLAISPIMMMAFMMGSGNAGMMGGMMGGRGSNPNAEAPVSGATEVRIENFAFSPANIVVDAGTTVRWTNHDGIGHTVTSDEGKELDSSLVEGGETFRHTFDAPGEYRYHCKPHPNMRGLVTVRAKGAG